ncbi:RHOMBOID-like protein 12, mitochondrial [Andrographis paniculata]|uniref:RHOMBOID-like protein 12, mitochondrial n=1 Tax=Andrographis paniculata TaxID=175694 RepID=UPI0021E8D35F|nr:RHOMBOID-like protein 12, mitochondrial [Andrographis paniculata]
MQRELSVKLLSRIAKNAPTTAASAGGGGANSIVRAQFPLFSPAFSKLGANPCSHFSAHSWKLYVYGGPWVTTRGFMRSVSAGRLMSNAVLKRTASNHASRNFHSFDSRRRGWNSMFGRLTADGVVIGLIVANAAVYILWNIASPSFMVKNFMISVDNFTSGRVHTLITAAFSHKDMWHLISNMVGLYFFGLSIGRSFGPEYLLKLYLSGAVVGSIFYLGYHAFIASRIQRTPMFGIDPAKVPGLGASGATNAIMLLDIFLFPTKTLYLDFIIPVPAILLGIFIIGKDMMRILQGDHQVSGSAHLGGATVAALAWAQLKRGRFRRF